MAPLQIARWRRPVGATLAVLALATIAVLTLTPQSVSEAETFGHFCVVCGSLGGSDMLANVLLFMPFGFALALAGMSGRRAALVGMAVSITVELLQYTAVPGRFATLSDVLTNTTGAALAAALVTHRRAWLRPSPRAAARLGALAGALFVGTLAIAAWALGTPHDSDASPPHKDAIPLPTGLGWFAGEVHRATVGDFTATNRGTGPITIAMPARSSVRASVDVSGFDVRPEFVPLLFLHRPGEFESWLMLGQKSYELLVAPAFRGERLRLRRPRIGVRRIGGWRHRAEAEFTLAAEVTSDRLTISVAQGGVLHSETVRLSPTLGWALLSPYPGLNGPEAPLATIAWLAGLALPFGYYARWTARGRRRAEVVAAGGVVTALVGGLAIVPLVGGFSTTRPWEWMGAIGGVLLGAVVAEVMRRLE